MAGTGVEAHIDTLWDHWPTDVYFCGLGREIITGNRKLPEADANDPVREAFARWSHALRDGRYSWDPVTVLFAVEPSLFVVDSVGSLVQNARFLTYWDPEQHRPGRFRVASARISSPELQERIETLISVPPLKKEAIR